VRAALIDGIAPAEQDRLRKLLRQVMANMERFEGAAGAAPGENMP
jgi:hypothetical protein